MKKAIIILLGIVLASCTFDYGEIDPDERESPNMVMENVEYIRVRSADPIARFQAERAERYEKQGVMKLQNFTFEQFGDKGNEVNTLGKAGNAHINIDSSDIFMDRGVRIEVASEDIIIDTYQLEWQDSPRILSTGEENIVNIYRENGTGFTGIGLRAETRNRTWEFMGSVSGTYIYDDKEDAAASAEAIAEEGEEEEFDFIFDI